MADYIFEGKAGSSAKMKEVSTKSLPWFRALMKELTIKSPISKSVAAGIDQYGKRKQQILDINSIGGMYSFIYDPKHKATLDYYDNFPLIFPIEMYSDGFLGVNIHYLPYSLRSQLLKALFDNRDILTDKEKKKPINAQLKINYMILKGFSSFNLVKPCIKRYLQNHVRTDFIRVPFDEWDFAALLPREAFAKKSKYDVWAETLKQINK